MATADETPRATAGDRMGIDLRGGVAVVTGAGAGIGEGIARAAAAQDMKLVLADVVGERVQAVADSINAAGTQAIAVVADVRVAAQMEQVAAQAYATFGDVTLLVNNAGIELLGLIWEIPEPEWQRAIDINVLGVVNGIRAFVPRMIAAGKRAAIANLSSIGGVGMAPLQTAYIVSKHAVLSLSECLALELDMVGAPIHVSAVMPGPVATRIFDDAPVSGEGAVVGHQADMRALLRDHGLDPLQAGERILHGVGKGDFWVSPHPAMMAQAMDRRAAVLSERRRPAINVAMQRQVMGNRA